MQTTKPATPEVWAPSVRQRLDKIGWALLPRFAESTPSEIVASRVGEPMAWDGPLVQRLTPKATSTPNTYSGIFGLASFPFHTDLAHWMVPPRYLLLRCVKGYADVPTLLLDGQSIAAAIGCNIMGRALVRPRRPRAGEIRLLRLFESGADGDVIRWDEVYLKPASQIGEEASQRIRAHIKAVAPTSVVMVDEGDVLILDNWRMLHSRPAISRDRRDRCLHRVYLRHVR